MAVNRYSINLLEYRHCKIQLQPAELKDILKYWRSSHETCLACLTCQNDLNFERYNNFTTCCQKFYYKPSNCYIPQSIAVKTEGYEFLLPSLQKILLQKQISTVDQEFLVIPDPIYWQVSSTLIYDKTMKLVTKTSMTKKSKQILPPSKSKQFYKQIQEAPLNHGSLFKRSGGKNTFFRQIAFGKRVIWSLRATIVPDPDLKPNQVTLPAKLKDNFFPHLFGKWIILNRMPSLQPENFVALKVSKLWECSAIGLNLEIMEAINGDFDGDETNVYIIQNLQSQAESEIILNSEYNMGSSTSGLKLNPCQDMKMAYYLFSDKISNISLLPIRNYHQKSLQQIFKIIYDLYDSKATFDCFDKMRQFYLDVFQNDIAFGISLAEIQRLEKLGTSCRNFEEFEKKMLSSEGDGCLVSQVKAGAKGSFYHLYQMFGSIGEKGENSFWRGITPIESIDHILQAYEGLLKSTNIWQPGYGYSKSVYNLQGLHVDYLGRLVDGGKVVIEKDVLDALYYTDVLSKESFAELIATEMI